MDKPKKIVVVGSLNMDFVVRVPHIPKPGETVLAQGVRNFCGGKGANQSVAIGRLNGNVSCIGRVGRDAHGKELENSLRESGVDTRGLVVDDEAPTGNAYINTSPQGENNIIVNAGANQNLDIEQINRFASILDGAEYCISQLEIPIATVEYLAQYCMQKGIKFILNPAPAIELNHSVFKGTYIIAPNEMELDALIPEGNSIEEKARKLLDKGYENVLVTLGEKGSLLLHGQEQTHFPIHEGFEVVDTTGAGDSFIGGLVCMLAEGKTMEEAIPYAALVAAIAVSRSGAQNALPARSVVDAYANR